MGANWIEVNKALSGMINPYFEEQRRKKQQQEELEMLFQKAMMEQKIQQQDPLQQLLKYGEVADALKKLGLNFGDLGMGGSNQGQPNQPIGQPMGQSIGQPSMQMRQPTITGNMGVGTTAPIQQMPQYNIRPKKYEPTAMGGIRATEYEPVKSEEEINQEIQSKAREQVVTQEQKKLAEEQSSTYKGLSLLNQIKNEWVKTTPPKRSSIYQQPLYGIQQRIFAPLQRTKNQEADYTYVRFIKGLRSRLAKGTIGTDVGNLSEFEQKVVLEAVPGLTDTYEAGTELLNKMEKALKIMVKARELGYKNLDDMLSRTGKTLEQLKQLNIEQLSAPQQSFRVIRKIGK